MFTINQKYGIGEVIEVTDTMVKVYFADEDVEKSLVKKLVTIYPTREAADFALNPEMTREEADKILADLAEEKRISTQAKIAQNWLEEDQARRNAELKRHI